MRRNRELSWIRHSHLFNPDDYECPWCGKCFEKAYNTCPFCGKTVSGQSRRTQDDWVDEAEELDWLLDDDE